MSELISIDSMKPDQIHSRSRTLHFWLNVKFYLIDLAQAYASAMAYIWAFAVKRALTTELHFKYSQLKNHYMFLLLWWEAECRAMISYACEAGMLS